jgi:hypothetical protein
MTIMTTLKHNRYRHALQARLRQRFGQVRTAPERDDASLFNGADRDQGHLDGGGWFVNCPFCQDREFNLYISDRYGQFDGQSESANLGLAVCCRRDCLHAPQNRRLLARFVFDSLQHNPVTIVSAAAVPAALTPESTTVSLPGHMLPLDALPSTHPAVRYVVQRGFELDELATVWQVGFCAESDYRRLRATGTITSLAFVDPPPFSLNADTLWRKCRHVRKVLRRSRPWLRVAGWSGSAPSSGQWCRR